MANIKKVILLTSALLSQSALATEPPPFSLNEFEQNEEVIQAYSRKVINKYLTNLNLSYNFDKDLLKYNIPPILIKGGCSRRIEIKGGHAEFTAGKPEIIKISDISKNIIKSSSFARSITIPVNLSGEAFIRDKTGHRILFGSCNKIAEDNFSYTFSLKDIKVKFTAFFFLNPEVVNYHGGTAYKIRPNIKVAAAIDNYDEDNIVFDSHNRDGLTSIISSMTSFVNGTFKLLGGHSATEDFNLAIYSLASILDTPSLGIKSSDIAKSVGLLQDQRDKALSNGNDALAKIMSEAESKLNREMHRALKKLDIYRHNEKGVPGEYLIPYDIESDIKTEPYNVKLTNVSISDIGENRKLTASISASKVNSFNIILNYEQLDGFDLMGSYGLNKPVYKSMVHSGTVDRYGNIELVIPKSYSNPHNLLKREYSSTIDISACNENGCSYKHIPANNMIPSSSSGNECIAIDCSDINDKGNIDIGSLINMN